MQNTIHIFLSILATAVVIGGIARVSVRRWERGHAAGMQNSDEASDASALLTYYSAGHDLVRTGSGVIDGMRYNMYLTSPPVADHGEAYVREPAVIYCLDLPFNTQAHLIGLSKSFGLDRLAFASFLTGVGLVTVRLEGDFPDRFDLYAHTGEDVQARMVLSPTAMTFIEEYCATHFWEIHDSELYFVVTENGIGNSNFIINSQQFMEAIRPALKPGDPGAPVVHHGVPYDIYDGPALACPICRTPMELHDEQWFLCASGHGVLVTGRELTRIEQGNLRVQLTATDTVRHGPLNCPHCGHPMQPLAYNGSQLEIDTCTNCAFRWLDADEVVALVGKKR